MAATILKGKKQDKGALDEHMELFRYYKSQRLEREKVWNRIYKMYRSYTDKKNLPWKTNLFIPLVFQAVENLLPRYVNGHIHFLYSPKEPGDVEAARQMTRLVNDYQLPTSRMSLKKLLWFKSEIMYGVGWAFPRWVIEKRPKPSKKSVKRVWKDTDKSVWEPWYEGIDMQVADIFNVWGDATADNEDESLAIIYEDLWEWDRFEMAYEQELKESGFDTADIKKSWSNVSGEYTASKQSIAGIGAPRNTQNNKQVAVMRFFYDHRWVTVVNREWVIEDIENPSLFPGKPVCRLASLPIKGELYTPSTVEQLISSQFEINDIRNQRMDNVKLSMDRMAIAARNSSLNKPEVKTAPGHIIWVDEPEEINNAIRFVDVPDVSQSGLIEENNLYRDYTRITGLSDLQTGTSGREASTATVGSILESRMQSKMSASTKSLAATGLQKLGMILAALNEQNMDKDYATRILGPDNEWKFEQTIKAKDLKWNMDLKVDFVPSNEISQQGMAQNLIQLYPYARQSTIIDEETYWHTIFELMNVPNNAKLFKHQEEKKVVRSDVMEAEQARQENVMLMSGNVVQAGNKDNHSVHLLIHRMAEKDAKTPDERDRIRQHVAQHIEMKTGQADFVEQQPGQAAPQPDAMAAAQMMGDMAGLQANPIPTGGTPDVPTYEDGTRPYTRNPQG